MSVNATMNSSINNDWLASIKGDRDHRVAPRAERRETPREPMPIPQKYDVQKTIAEPMLVSAHLVSAQPVSAQRNEAARPDNSNDVDLPARRGLSIWTVASITVITVSLGMTGYFLFGSSTKPLTETKTAETKTAEKQTATVTPAPAASPTPTPAPTPAPAIVPTPTPAPTLTPIPAPSPLPAQAVPNPAGKTEVTVDAQGPADYQTLAQAVAQSKPGTRIRVRPGTYRESVIIDKAIEIVGDGAAKDIVVESNESNALTIRADGVVVRNIALRTRTFSKDAMWFPLLVTFGQPLVENCDLSSESAAAAFIQGANANPTLKNCVFHDCRGCAVHFIEQSRGQMNGCQITGCTQAGIVVSQSAMPVVTGCTASNGLDGGVIVNPTGRGVFLNCVFSNNAKTGATVRGLGSNPIFRDCTFSENQSAGFMVTNAGYATVDGCTMANNKQSNAYVDQGGTLTLTKCNLRNGRDAGIFVNGGNATIVACEIDGHDDVGIAVEKNSRASVTSTTIRNCRNGLWVVSPDSVVVGFNNIPAAPAQSANNPPLPGGVNPGPGTNPNPGGTLIPGGYNPPLPGGYNPPAPGGYVPPTNPIRR